MAEYMPIQKGNPGDAHALLLDDGDHGGVPMKSFAAGPPGQQNPAAAAAQRAVAAVRSTLSAAGGSGANLLAGAPESLEDQGSYVPATVVPHTAS